MSFSKIFHVRREERFPALLGTLFFFLVMTALMMLRPAREALGMQHGIDQVRWLFVGTALVTLLVNPAFGWLVSRYRRFSFVSATYVFFALSLVGFWAVLVFSPQKIGERSGQVFFVWFSVFNLFSVMVFWAVLADRFTLEQSKRFFSLIAAGGTLGAIFGPWLASKLVVPFGTPMLLLVAGVFLLLAIIAARGLMLVKSDQSGLVGNEVKAADQMVIGGHAWGGFHAVFGSRYLLGIAFYVVILAIVMTFIYFTRMQMVAAMQDDLNKRTELFAYLDMITQISTLVLQMSITGWLMKRVGVSVTLALLPLTVLFGFIGLAIVGSLVMVVILDAMVKAVERAVMRPARETLFTVVSREDKYKAKAFIDTFVYRGGDVIGAQGVGLGVLALSSLVIPISVGWVFLGIWLGRRQRELADERMVVEGAEGE